MINYEPVNYRIGRWSNIIVKSENRNEKTCRIAAIPGDGIGKEVLPEGIRVLQAAEQRWDLSLSFEQMEWASCEYYAHHGKMMPDDWREQLQGFDAIYFGAVGWPDTVPDHISLWGRC